MWQHIERGDILIAQVKIDQQTIGGPSRVCIGDKEIQGVKDVYIKSESDTVPQIELHVAGGFSFDSLANVEVNYTPNVVHEAVSMVRNELNKKGEMYNELLVTIKEVIEKAPNYTEMNALAKLIVEKIIGR